MQGSDKAEVSPATAPDLDWSQVSETVRMLNLAVAQVSMAMHEGEDSPAALPRSYTGMAVEVEGIAEMASGEKAKERPDGPASSVPGHCASVQSGIGQSIVAIQCHDRHSQRLDHVRFAHESLAGLLADKARLHSQDERDMLQQGVRSNYGMREAPGMFEARMNGATTEKALDIVRKRFHEGDIDDIDLC